MTLIFGLGGNSESTCVSRLPYFIVGPEAAENTTALMECFRVKGFMLIRSQLK